MKRITAAALAIMLILALFPAAALADGADYSAVRVKLTTNNATSIVMNVTGEYFINENGALFSGGSLTLRSDASGVIVASHSVLGDIYSGKTITIKRVDMAPSAGSMYFNGRRYLGHFSAKRLSSGYIQIVNEVPMAHYLYGVVAYEMNDNYPLDALRSQAIAAKCYVINSINLSPRAEYHIGDTSSDQVYKGYNSSYKNVISAVDSTMDYVLSVNGGVLCTYYSASNGGETSLPSFAWPAKNVRDAGYAVYLDEYDIANTYSMNEKVKLPINSKGTISDALFRLILAKAYSVIGVQPDAIAAISYCEVNSPKLSGSSRNMSKVSMIVSVGVGGTLYSDIQLNFSVSDLYTYGVVTNANLRTYWGELSADGTAYTIHHVRFGHGVGLSQRGAQQRASAGMGFAEILGFYYPGASIATLVIPMMENPAKPSSVQTLTRIGTGITTGKINLRTGASADFDALGKLEKGTSLTIYELSNGWYHVLVDGTSVEGWVSGEYIQFAPDATATPTPEFSALPDASPSPSALSTPAPVAYGIMSSGGVNFRSGPATSYQVLKVLQKDAEVSVISSAGGWYYALVGGDYGYVSSSYVKITANATPAPEPSPSATPAPEQTPTATVVDIGVITSSGVNFREGPDSSYRSMRKLDKNTGIVVLDLLGKWYYVLVGTQPGYVHRDYVKITGTSESAENAVTSTEGAGQTTGSVNMRVGPGTQYAKLKTLSKGTELSLYEIKNGWYRAKNAAGNEGWVSSKYVSVTKAIPESPANTGEAEGDKPTGTGVTTSKVNFREGPGTSTKTITQLRSGVTVTLYELSGSWYAAEYNGMRGYLFAKYVKLVSTTGAETPTLGAIGGVSPESGSGVTPAGGGLTLATGSTSGKLNMRTKPSTSGSGVITTLSPGARFNIIGECGEWYYILYGGKTGYVYKAYASLASSGTAAIGAVSETLTCISTSTGAEVNLRIGPGTGNAKISTLKKGTALMVYLIKDGWCLVEVNGVLGYASADYIKLG